jgi:hypothetical protein
MKKMIAVSVLLFAIPASVVWADDLGLNFPTVTDSVNEYNAKAGASALGITTMYDHPTQAPQGQIYVPVEYNRAGDPAAGEQDPNAPKNTTDIDYVPLSQLKGATGQAGAVGGQGSAGTQGVKGDKGDTGAQGAPGDSGLDATRENIGVTVRLYDHKRFSVTSGYRYDVHHHGQEIDMAVLNIKLGKSWEEELIAKQAKRLSELEIEMSQLMRKGNR